MCRFRNWYYDDGGYIIQCEDCKHFQICFGTMMLTLDEAQYYRFSEMVQQRKEEHVIMLDSDSKCIVLPTTADTIHIILSEKEFIHIHEMVQSADAEIKTDQLIRMFNVEM